MIEVYSAAALARDPALYDEMLRLRYRVFHERLGWDVPTRSGFDFDQYDVCSPNYILAFNDDHRIVGCWRLLPTTGPYMLNEVFSELLEGNPAPTSPLIWESSRFAVDTEYDGKAGLGAVHRYSAELFCALVEFAMASGIDEVLTVYDVRIARLLNRLGAKALWTSGRHQVGNTIAVAGRFRCDADMLNSIRQSTGITHNVITSYNLISHKVAA